MEQSHLFKKLIVTEDDKVLQRFYSQALADLCQELNVVESPQKAVEAMHNGACDFLITDLKLNETNGLEVVEKAISKNANIKILVASGYVTDQEYHDKMQNIPQIKGYLQKPFTLEELIQKIKSIAGVSDNSQYQ